MLCMSSFAQEDVTAKWDFVNNCAGLDTKANGGKYTAATMASDVSGIEMTINYNGGQIKNNDNSYMVGNGVEMQIPVKAAGDEVTVVGYTGYFHYSIGGTEATEATTTHKATNSEALQGYVSVLSTGSNNYINSITVVQKAPKEATTLDNEAITATFPFNLGTEGQKATFSESDADYFLTSSVKYGSNLKILQKNSKAGFDETTFQPSTKESAASDANLIQFLITPRPGFTFTPTKVSFKSTRFGTGGGSLDFSWINPDKSKVSLATGRKPCRENGEVGNNGEASGAKFTAFEYDITGATPGEGACGLGINLYSLDNNKEVGFADIIIEGTLSGTEKEVPILASFKINGKEYTTEEVFGEEYEGTLELSKKEAMVGEGNPLTEVTAASGEVGTVTYSGNETSCVVTIPMTAGATTMNYVMTIVQKPDYTLTYINTDGTEMGTQIVEKDAAIGEFAVNIETATSTEGKKARGWFMNDYVGEKFTTASVITGNAKLYAIETEIEGPSDSKKYVFDLTNKVFYQEDHEAFVVEGSGKPHTDIRHGWVFSNGDKIHLLVGAKASIALSLCQYANASAKIKTPSGEELAAKVDNDGGVQSFNYEGEPGTITLEITGGTTYIHKITILNTTTTNYDKQGNWFIVKANDGSSLLDAIDAANGTAGDERTFIYLPNGTYDFGQTTLTTIGRNNLSIIGESTDGVIIKNRPIAEGIAVTATLLNTSNNLYIQDVTIKNDYPYDPKASAGRAVTIQDKGNKTICKNVKLLSFQDTYYSNNNNSQYYFEDSEIHGTVDYVCGGGDVYFNRVKFYNEERSSGDCISAPNTPKQYGYIFNECTIDGHSGQAGKYRLGRPWANGCAARYINTTMYILPNDIGWDGWGNENAPIQFGEYNSVDKNGNPVDLSKRAKTIGTASRPNTPIITSEEAANYTIGKVLSGWDVVALATQAAAPTNAKMEGNVITWDAVEGAVKYLVECNNQFVAITDDPTYTIQAIESAPLAKAEPTATSNVYTVRAANAQGGFGEKAMVVETTGINEVNVGANVAKTEYFNLAGARVNKNFQGAAIQVQKLNNGQHVAKKVILK